MSVTIISMQEGRELTPDLEGHIAPKTHLEGESVVQKLPRLRDEHNELLYKERLVRLDKDKTAQEKVVLPQTETITIKSPSHLDTDSVRIGPPIRQATFSMEYGKARKVEQPVYADFSIGSPSDKDSLPVRYALINDQYQDKIVRFTESPSGDRTVTQEPVLLEHGLQRISPDGSKGMNISRKDETLTIKPDSEVEVEAEVPMQDDMSVRLKDGTILTDREIQHYASEFPEGVGFDAVLHPGTHSIESPEQFKQKLQDQVKAGWVIAAKGLGLSLDQFPLEEVNLWTPAVEKEGRKGFGAVRKIKEMYYRNRPSPRGFRQNFGGFTGHSESSGGPVVHMPVSESGTLEADAMVHELLHAYFDSKKIGVHPNEYGQILNEGLGTIGDFLPAMMKDGKMPDVGGERITSSFSRFREALESGEKDSGSLSSHGQSKDLRTHAYNPANTLLHWYLLAERGGLDTMKEVVGGMKQGKRLAQISRMFEGVIGDTPVIRTREELLEPYEKVFSEPMVDLLDKAEEWYYRQRLDQASAPSPS